MFILQCLGIAVAAVYLMFGLFLMMMPLKRNAQAGNLTVEAKVLGYPWLAVMIVADFLFNITFGTLIFANPPTQLLLTTRLDQMLLRSGWRQKTAQYICTRYLDRFDPDGHHCEPKTGGL